MSPRKSAGRKLRDIMTPAVEIVPPDVTVREAAEKMKSEDLGSLAVCEDGKIVGVLTDREITLRLAAEGRDPGQTRVREVMNPDPVCCSEDQSLADAVRLMEEKRQHRAFVVDAQGALLGIVSLGKLARAGGERVAGEVVERISKPRGGAPRRRTG
ncbi:MAG TPA: CBS domain-containing protein [Planctomycetota bacterium]|jgi:CBS domain-containing protein|nr:CBS domain-containing protein [Planctomycetota bacterium]